MFPFLKVGNSPGQEFEKWKDKKGNSKNEKVKKSKTKKKDKRKHRHRHRHHHHFNATGQGCEYLHKIGARIIFLI